MQICFHYFYNLHYMHYINKGSCSIFHKNIGLIVLILVYVSRALYVRILNFQSKQAMANFRPSLIKHCSEEAHKQSKLVTAKNVFYA